MKISRFVITGARDSCPPEDLGKKVLHWAYDLAAGHCELVHGVAPGVDSTLSFWAEELGWTVHYRQAEWEMEGKKAGPIRNRKMLEGHCDCHPDDIVIPRMVLAFHDDLKRSKGTLDCITQAGHLQIPVLYWGYEWAN